MNVRNRTRITNSLLAITLILPLLTGACSAGLAGREHNEAPAATQTTVLPEPRTDGPCPLEEALQRRRSVRAFRHQSLTSFELSQLLWAAQGMTDPGGYRTAPSAGALYPLELYAVTPEGVYRYDSADHALARIREGDPRRRLHQAALSQEPVLHAPLILVVTAVYGRTEAKYGPERSPRYVHLEAGHAAQNVLLEAVCLGLGAVPIGAFHDADVQRVLDLPQDHHPLYLIPIGHPE